MVGPGRGEGPAQRRLGAPIGLGDLGGVGLAVDAQVVGPEAGQRDGVGQVGQLEGQLEIGVHGYSSRIATALAVTFTLGSYSGTSTSRARPANRSASSARQAGHGP